MTTPRDQINARTEPADQLPIENLTLESFFEFSILFESEENTFPVAHIVKRTIVEGLSGPRAKRMEQALEALGPGIAFELEAPAMTNQEAQLITRFKICFSDELGNRWQLDENGILMSISSR